MSQGPLNVAIGNKASNAYQPIRIDQQNSGWVTSRRGKLYASSYGTPAIGSTAAVAGASFACSTPASAPQTLSNALATTYVGCCLNNPAASGVNLSVKRVMGGVMVAPAAFLALGLIVGWSAAGVITHTTSISTNIVAQYVGAATASGSVLLAAAAKGLVDSACTIVGTPLWHSWFAFNATGGTPQFNVDLDDALIVPPGGYVAIGASAAGPTTGFLGGFYWEELLP